MTTRYQERHYEDVALILCIGATANVELPVRDVTGTFIRQFADLFAADNPASCIHYGEMASTASLCISANDRLRDEHNFEGGFDRERFLTACGLERER